MHYCVCCVLVRPDLGGYFWFVKCCGALSCFPEILLPLCLFAAKTTALHSMFLTFKFRTLVTCNPSFLACQKRRANLLMSLPTSQSPCLKMLLFVFNLSLVSLSEFQSLMSLRNCKLIIEGLLVSRLSSLF